MKNMSGYKKGLLLVFLNALSTGTVGFIDKVGSGNVQNPLLFSVQSVCVSFTLLFILSLFFYKKSFIETVRQTKRSSWIFVFFVGVFASGFFILFRFLGIMQSTGTFASLSIVVTATLTAFAAYLFLGERLKRSFWMFFILIVLSMYVFSTGQIGFATIKAGDALILIGTLFLASGNVFTKLALKNTPPMLVTLGRFFFGSLFLLFITVFLFNQNDLFSTLSFWVVLSGIFWSISAILFNFSIKYLGVTLATMFLMLSPIFTLILEYIFLHYTFNPFQIGAVIVVVASGIFIFLPKHTS